MKPWYKSKTMWFNIATVGGAVLAGVVGLLPTLQFMLSPQAYAITFMVIGAVNVLLRSITESAIGNMDKDSSE